MGAQPHIPPSKNSKETQYYLSFQKSNWGKIVICTGFCMKKDITHIYKYIHINRVKLARKMMELTRND